MKANGLIYQIKITLKEVKPPVWRRVQVEGDISLHVLHKILNEAMGWMDSHLYQFRIGETYYSVPDPDGEFPAKNSETVRLSRLVPKEKARFVYEYDFGDGWEHEVLLEKIMPPEPGKKYPLCLAGARACPPEDCGGDGGYAELLEILKDPKHERYAEMTEWLERPFDPEAFNLNETDQTVRRAPSRVEFR